MTHFSQVTDIYYYKSNDTTIHWAAIGNYKKGEPYIIQTDEDEVTLRIREVHPSPDAPVKKGWTLLVLEKPLPDIHTN